MCGGDAAFLPNYCDCLFLVFLDIFVNHRPSPHSQKASLNSRKWRKKGREPGLTTFVSDKAQQVLSQVLYITPTTLILPSHPFTYPSGSYNYNSIKICKQISTPPQPYQKIPDIYFLRSCSLPNFITIPSPITIQFVVDVFVLYVILYLLLYCLLCYLVLRPQSWINSTLLSLL